MKQDIAVGDTGQELIDKLSNNFDELYGGLPKAFSPHLWDVGEEIDLGDGSYGRRFTGSISAAINTPHTLSLVQQNLRLLDCGGWWYPSTSTRANFPSSFGTVNNLKVECEIRWTSSGGLALHTCTSGTRNSTQYDIWIRYTK